MLKVSSDLTRPAFVPMQLPRNKFEWAFLIPPPAAGGSGTYLVLLQVGFTYLPQSLRVLVSSYLTFSPLPTETEVLEGGIFSVALSLSRLSGTVRITDHPALWSSDFPPLLVSRFA